MRKFFTVSFMLAVAAPLAQQAQPVTPPEVASPELTSVKRNNSGSERASNRAQPNGGFSATNVTLRSVIARAYEVRSFQVTGGPNWLDSDRFDIVVRGSEGTSNRLRPALLRALLADRFKFVAHFETKEQPVYALVLARNDRRFGPQLTRSVLACSGKTSAPQPGQSDSCGVDTSMNDRLGTISASGMSMDAIAAALANFAVNRTVVNRTGLEGAFDVELRFAPEGVALTGANRGDDAPPIFTAIQEQLGLRLQSERGPVPYVVIDSVQPPTPD